jgi:hypothetical protein
VNVIRQSASPVYYLTISGGGEGRSSGVGGGGGDTIIVAVAVAVAAAVSTFQNPWPIPNAFAQSTFNWRQIPLAQAGAFT